MAEDIKEETENPSEEEISDGLIPEDDDSASLDESSNENEETIEENTNEEPATSPQEETPTETQATQNDTEEIDVVEDEENPVQKKQTKIQKILMITIGVLGGVLILGIILYLFGVFDPEEPPKPVATPEMMDMNQTKKPEKYIFDSKDINIDRLNGKLRILTKYEIIGTQEEERQKELEKNSKLSTAQINELLKAEQEKKEEAEKKAQEDLKKAQVEKIEKEKEEKIKKEEERIKESQRPFDLLKFIQVSINDSLLASINDEAKKYNVKISKCSDNSQEFYLIGPFKSNKELNQAFRAIYNTTPSTTKKDLARLEFNRVCK